MVTKQVVAKPSRISLTQAQYDDAIRAAKEESWDAYSKLLPAKEALPNPHRPVKKIPESEQITRVSARKKIAAEILWYVASDKAHAYLSTEISSLCGIGRPMTNELPSSANFTSGADFCEVCFPVYNKLIQKQGGGTERAADAHGIFV